MSSVLLVRISISSFPYILSISPWYHHDIHIPNPHSIPMVVEYIPTTYPISLVPIPITSFPHSARRMLLTSPWYLRKSRMISLHSCYRKWYPHGVLWKQHKVGYINPCFVCNIPMFSGYSPKNHSWYLPISRFDGNRTQYIPNNHQIVKTSPWYPHFHGSNTHIQFFTNIITFTSIGFSW